MDLIHRLHAGVSAVCPIVGVSIGDDADSSTWAFEPAPDATQQQVADAAQIVATFDPAKPVAEDIAKERERRLALGFDYNFGDARGVHRIGTKASDMVGWGEVSTYAGALLDSGDVTTTIAIVTDTGPCLVTAPEWRAIEIAAADFRQPLWAKSFALMATLPTDYTSDEHWT